MDKELYINDQLVDIGDNTVVAITRQINDIASLGNRQGDRTNQFTIPYTLLNDRILGWCRKVESGSSVPYTRLTVKFIDAGVEVIPQGYGVVTSASDGYKLTVYSGNSDFFSLLDGLKLSDLDLEDISHYWDGNQIASSYTNTDGFIYPVIDFGGASAGQALDIDVSRLFPNTYIHTLISKIVEGRLWELDLQFTDQRYNKTVMSFSKGKWENSQAWTDAQALSLTHDNPVTVNKVAVWPSLPHYEDMNLDDNDKVDSNIITPTRTGWYKIDTRYNWSASGDNNDRWQVVLWNITDNEAAADDTQMMPSGTIPKPMDESTGSPEAIQSNAVELTYAVWLLEGCTYKLRVCFTASGPQGSTGFLEITDMDISIAFYSNDIKMGGPDVPGKPDAYGKGGSWVNMADQMPDISQKDFMKAVMNIFCLVPDSKDNTLTLRQFNIIKTNLPNAVDMSSKAIGDEPSISFKAGGNYAQRNYFKWNNDDAVLQDLGKGYFDISDTTLAPQVDQITLPFSATDMVLKTISGSEIYIPQIPLLNGDAAFGTKEYDEWTNLNVWQSMTEQKPRLLVLDIDPSIQPYSFEYNDVTLSEVTTINSSIPHVYFKKDDGSYNLDWQTLLEEYYELLVETLKNFKLVEDKFRLTGVDLLNLNHFIPWYIDKYSANFYVNKIKDYKRGQLTSVELIRL